MWTLSYSASCSKSKGSDYCLGTQLCLTLQLRGQQHVRLPCPSLSPGVCSNSRPLSRRCHPTISSSVAPSFPALNLSQHWSLFQWVSQSTGASASASALPMNTQDWYPLWLTGLISLLFKGLSRVFSNTTVQKHQFFGAQLSLYSKSHIHTWLLEKP